MVTHAMLAILGFFVRDNAPLSMDCRYVVFPKRDIIPVVDVIVWGGWEFIK